MPSLRVRPPGSFADPVVLHGYDQPDFKPYGSGAFPCFPARQASRRGYSAESLTSYAQISSRRSAATGDLE